MLRQEFTGKSVSASDSTPQLDVLRDAIPRSEPMVRLAIVEALQTIGGEGAIDTLTVLTKDKSNHVATAAKAAAAVLQAKAIEKALEESAPNDNTSTSNTE